MWASIMFIHEMRLESCVSVYVAEHLPPRFLLRLEFHSQWISSQLVGKVEDTFLWGTYWRYVSLSKAGMLLTFYSLCWAPQRPVERLCKRSWRYWKHREAATVLPLLCRHVGSRSTLLEVAGVVSSHLDNCSTTSTAVINWDSCCCGVQVHQAGVSF